MRSYSIMREYLLGALGVAFAYPAIWYQMEPEPVAEKREATAPRRIAPQRAAQPERRSLRESPARPIVPSHVESTIEVTPPTEPTTVAPSQPRVRAPNMALAPLPEALPATINEMSELQRLAGDPMRLAERVQGLESNAAELDQLKAFAERFVALPPDRVEQRIMNPSGRAASSRPSRAAGR
jgi:hypothetical protein